MSSVAKPVWFHALTLTGEERHIFNPLPDRPDYLPPDALAMCGKLVRYRLRSQPWVDAIPECRLCAARAVTLPGRGVKSCCDMHNQYCEPPGDLCCHYCPEVLHGSRTHSALAAFRETAARIRETMIESQHLPECNDLCTPDSHYMKDDPTHGRIDRDIQQLVDEMEPKSLGQRVAMENTLQSRRDKGNRP